MPDVLIIAASEGQVSLGASAYRTLREAIITGQLRPNERLIERELAKRLEISRTPVRESLQRLAGEGLILPAGQGWIVREHTRKEVKEIYQVRAALEGYAARLAASNASDSDLVEIERLYDVHLTTLDNEERPTTLAHNDDFHDAVVAASGNEFLANQIKQNREYYFMHRVAVILPDEELRDAMRAHHLLLDALKLRDENKSEQAARDLIEQGMSRALAQYH